MVFLILLFHFWSPIRNMLYNSFVNNLTFISTKNRFSKQHSIQVDLILYILKQQQQQKNKKQILKQTPLQKGLRSYVKCIFFCVCACVCIETYLLSRIKIFNQCLFACNFKGKKYTFVHSHSAFYKYCQFFLATSYNPSQLVFPGDERQAERI